MFCVIYGTTKHLPNPVAIDIPPVQYMTLSLVAVSLVLKKTGLFSNVMPTS